MKENTYCKKCKFFKIKDNYYDYSECPGSKPGAIQFMDESLENDYQCPYYQKKDSQGNCPTKDTNIKEEVFKSEKCVLNAIKTCRDRIDSLQKEYKLELDKWHSRMNGGQFVQKDYSLYSQYLKLKQDIENLRIKYISSLDIREGFKNL